jgi:YD repeat-containing protein
MHAHGLLADGSRRGTALGRARRSLWTLLRRVHPALLVLAALACVLPFPTSATTYYKYDILGRVIQVVESDGTTTTYTYDADGNITSITRTPGTTTLSITSISSTSGATGSSVTIDGSGFSDIASQDSVTFNGVSGTIIYASGNRIVVAVPAGATSGDIGITTPNGSTSSSSSFTIIPVAITGLTPSSGAAGAVVTVTGSGFDPTAANDSVSLNGTAGTVSSASATQLQFAVPSGAMAGHITVSTSSGSATSSGDFFLPISAYSSNQVVDVAELSPGGPGHIFTIDALSQVAAALFDGTQGQMMTLTLTNVSMGAQYFVYAPDGSMLTSGNVEPNGLVVLPALASSGTYSFYLVPGSTVGSATVSLQTDASGVLQDNGTPAAVSLGVGQDASYAFTGTAGQLYSLELTQLTSSGYASLAATIVGPSGSVVASCGTYNTLGGGNCDFSLSASGSYTVHLVPGGLYASSFNILLNEDFTAALTAGTPGPSVAVSLVGGQHGLLTFSASAGETLALYLGSVAITPSTGGVAFVVLNSSGNSVASASAPNGGSGTINLPNLAAGTYSVLITPQNQNSGPSSMQVALATGVTGTVPTDGTTGSFQTYVPGQDVYLTMAGTTGQSLGLGLTQVSLNPSSTTSAFISITRPDGGNLTSADCYTSSRPGCQISLQNLPLTGNYGIVVSPSGQSTMSFGITSSRDVSGTLTLNQSTSVTLSDPGQNGLFTFTTDGSQPMVLYVGSISTSPSGGSVLFYVYNSSGTLVAQGSIAAGNSSINLGTLASGTYTVLIAPNNAASASLQVTLQPAPTGALPTNGTSVNFGTSTPGQTAYINFAATSGQTFSLALTGLVTSPSSVTSIAVQIKNPDGSSFTSTTCGTYWPGCEIRLQNLPQTGTYSLTVTPNGQASITFSATLSPDVSGSLTLGTPLSVNLGSVGQSGAFTFTLTSQQTVAVEIGSLSLSPANSTLFLNVLHSNGTTVTGGGGSTTTGMTENLTNLPAGTYTVQIVPEFPATGTLQLLLEPAAGGTLSPVSSGSGGNFATQAPGQNTYVTFSANAGDNDSVAISDLAFSPSSARYADVQINGPSNQLIEYGISCYAPGCELTLWNLPQTGTYTVTISPAGQATTSFTATLSQDVTGTLTSGSPQSVSLDAMGQSALLTFTIPSTQTVALNLTSLSLSPAGTTVYAYLYNAAGTQVAQTSSSTGATLNLPSLAAGTYTVRLVPSSPATGNMQVTLEPGVGGALTATSSGSGASFTTPAPGQDAYFTFSGNAGDNDSLAITGLSFSPTSTTSAYFSVTSPSGQNVGSTNCYASIGSSCWRGHKSA